MAALVLSDPRLTLNKNTSPRDSLVSTKFFRIDDGVVSLTSHNNNVILIITTSSVFEYVYFVTDGELQLI